MASFWCRGKRANHLLDTTDSYVSGSARETGTAAKTVALCKEAKCHTAKNLSFQPVGCGITGDRGRSDFVIFDRAGSQDFGVLRFMLLYSVSTLFCCGNVFTARCTLVQSAVLPSHVVCLSVCLSVCNVGEL